MLVPQCHLTFQSEMACTCMYMYTLHCVVLMESVTPFPVYFSDFSITLWPHADLHAFYSAGSRFTLKCQPTSVPNQQVLLQNDVHIEPVSLLLLIFLHIPLTPPPTPPPTPAASQLPAAPSLPAQRQSFQVWNPSLLPPSQVHIQMEVG